MSWQISRARAIHTVCVGNDYPTAHVHVVKDIHSVAFYKSVPSRAINISYLIWNNPQIAHSDWSLLSATKRSEHASQVV